MMFSDSITSETTFQEACADEVSDGSLGPVSRRPAKKAYKRRVVCKARGLSKKHNAETAYFEIQANAPHGLLLSCSHSECMASGRKFRYCQVCAMPVAKRNFLLRHGHGLFQTSKELKEEVDEVCDSLLQEDVCQPCVGSSEGEDVKPHHRRVVSFEGRRRRLEGQLDAEEQEWLHLLHQRPDVEDEPKMLEWMEKIMKISEQKRAQLKKASGSKDEATTMNASVLETKATTTAESRRNSTILALENVAQGSDAPIAADVSGYATLFEEIDIENLFNFEQSTGGVETGNK